MQSIKGMFLALAIALISVSLYHNTLHAEWFNSRAPESDSSNLKAIRDSLERINTQMDAMIEVQKQMVEALKNQAPAIQPAAVIEPAKTE